MTALTVEALDAIPRWVTGGTPSTASGTQNPRVQPFATIVRVERTNFSDSSVLEARSESLSLVGTRTKELLMRQALQSVQALLAEGAVDVTPASLNTLLTMLQTLIQDGTPLPQVGASASRGVETHWLVGGTLVSLIVGAHGDWLLWGEDDDGHDVFEAEGEPNDPLPLSVALDARETLHEMGLSVRIWPDAN